MPQGPLALLLHPASRSPAGPPPSFPRSLGLWVLGSAFCHTVPFSSRETMLLMEAPGKTAGVGGDRTLCPRCPADGEGLCLWEGGDGAEVHVRGH